MAKEYIELEIVADPDLVDQLVGVMSVIGFEGFWEEEAVLKCYITTERWSPGMHNEVLAIVRSVVRSSSSATPRVSVKKLDDQNWNEQWEKTIRPLKVTDRIVVTPTWHTYRPVPGEIVLQIDPKMSFGTGYHESTRLVLKLLEKCVTPGIKLLDIGTGTGVLAIAGVKLGARHAIAVDNDEWAFRNALENARLNDVEDRVRVIHGELSAVTETEFDIIVANIQSNVIASILESIKNHLARTGIVLLSGLLREDSEPMQHRMTASGLTILDEISENEWIAMTGGFPRNEDGTDESRGH